MPLLQRPNLPGLLRTTSPGPAKSTECTNSHARYAAFAKGNVDYLVATMDPASRPRFNPEEARRWIDTADFVGLEILEATEDSKTAFVEFKAWFIEKALPLEKQVHHERSLFRKKDGAWYYTEAKTPHHS